MQTLTNNMLDNNAAWLGLTILDRAAAYIESGRVNQAMDDIFTGLRTTRDNMSDEDWADYLYMRRNSKGAHAERWRHVHGCARFFNALRDTTSDQILATYRIGEATPSLSAP